MTAPLRPTVGLTTLRSPLANVAGALIWPLLVGGCLAAIVWADLNALRDPVRGALTLGMLVVVAVLELWLPLDRNQRLQGERRVLHDLGHLFANAVGGIAAVALPFAVPWLLSDSLSSLFGGVLWPGGLPWLAQCVLAVMAADLLGYWVHRLEHRAPVFWAYHVVHHDIDRLHIVRGTREHFVTNLIRGLLIFGPLLAVGAPVEALFAYQTLATTHGSIAHANLRLVFPAWMHRWIITPPVHRIHHAKQRSLSDSNYSTITPLWDRVFRTFTDPMSVSPPEIGAEDSQVPDSFVGQLGHPFREWFRLGARQDPVATNVDR